MTFVTLIKTKSHYICSEQSKKGKSKGSFKMKRQHDDMKAEEHSDGTIAGVSIAMIVVALASMALAL